MYTAENSPKLLAGSCFGPSPMLRVAWLPHAPLRRLHEKLTVFFLENEAGGLGRRRVSGWPSKGHLPSGAIDAAEITWPFCVAEHAKPERKSVPCYAE